MKEYESETYRVEHGDNLEIFTNATGMITVKIADVGTDDRLIVISKDDVDMVCDILHRLADEVV
jgi:hypothetical protein